MLAGRVRRAKVRPLLGFYKLKRRRESGLGVVRNDLTVLGITTIPEFETTGFDDQVRFVEIGEEAAIQADEAPEDNAAFALEAIPSGSTARFRALLTTFDAYERFVDHLVSNRKARIFQHGQNPRRQDRDRFPFLRSLRPMASMSTADRGMAG